MKFVIGLHNAKRGRAQFPPIGGIVARQEMNTSGTRRLRRDRKEYRHWRTRLLGQLVTSWRHPQFHQARWGRTMTLVMGGIAKITPNRGVTRIILQHRRTGLRYAVINAHMVNAAFNGRFAWRSRRVVGAGAWRRWQWTRHRNRLERMCRHTRKRYPNAALIVMGDFNTHDSLNLPHVRRVPGAPNSVDHIYLDHRLDGEGMRSHGLRGADHQFRTCVVRDRRKPRQKRS